MELEKIGVVIENVLLTSGLYGQLTIDIYNDKIQMPSPQNKPLLLASLKKCHVDLELFSLETKSKSASQMYSKNAQQIEHILNKVTYLLKESNRKGRFYKKGVLLFFINNILLLLRLNLYNSVMMLKIHKQGIPKT